MAEQYLNKEGVQTLWTAVKGKISTAQTTVENEFVNGTKKAKYAQQADNIGGVALSGLVQSIKVGSKTFSPKNSVVTLDDYALSTHTHTFASLTSKPTTISGYGITDAYTKKESDGKYATKATTLAGYGITDAYTKTESDKKYQPVGNYSSAGHTHTFASLTSKPTTLSGYGITDVYTKTESDGKYATKTESDGKYQPVGSYATLDSSGHVPSSQLPSYVDDVIEGYYSNGNFYSDSAKTKKITGEGGKIYTDLATNKTYRWGGTAWVEISKSLAIGETAGTAYDGAKGAKNASDISLLKTDVSTLKTDNTQNKKDITNLKANVSSIQSQVDTNSNNIGLINTDVISLKANVYTKTESDEKYVPYTGATKEVDLGNNMLIISGDTPDEILTLDCYGLCVESDSGVTRYGNHEISYSTTGVNKILYFPGAEGTTTNPNVTSDVIAVRSDLPTAISASDLNTILV